ncbi:MAG: TraB/GumN family protein [Hydrogenophaga sp.]
MKSRFWAALAGWLWIWGVASAQTGGEACPPNASYSPEMFAKAAEQARDRGFLWRIERDGRSSYLYGTLHVGKAEWMSPGPVMRDALRQVDAVALEVDITSAESQKTLIEIFQRPQRAIHPDLSQRLERLWLSECLPLDRLGIGPVELQAIGLAGLRGRRQGFDPGYSSEKMLTGLARGQKMPVFALESVGQQLKLFMADSDAEAAEAVASVLTHLEKPQARLMREKLINAWAKSDMGVLERYQEWCECVTTEREQSAMKALLDDRNPGLADGIERLHAGGQRVFAAVGALHMTGPLALQGLLQAQGFAVTRLF